MTNKDQQVCPCGATLGGSNHNSQHPQCHGRESFLRAASDRIQKTIFSRVGLPDSTQMGPGGVYLDFYYTALRGEDLAAIHEATKGTSWSFTVKVTPARVDGMTGVRLVLLHSL